MLHLPRMHITRPCRTSVALEEERPWVGSYRHVANLAIAAEVIAHLDCDADLKRSHPALYLRCKVSVHKKKARRARAKRMCSFMRRIVGGLLPHPERRTRGQLRPDARFVVAGLPESTPEPAQHAVNSLPRTAELTAQPASQSYKTIGDQRRRSITDAARTGQFPLARSLIVAQDIHAAIVGSHPKDAVIGGRATDR